MDARCPLYKFVDYRKHNDRERQRSVFESKKYN